MREEYGWNSVELRDGRYNQVIHMVSAAKGAEPFYCTELHATRYEDLDLARKLDDFASQVRSGVTVTISYLFQVSTNILW